MYDAVLKGSKIPLLGGDLKKYNADVNLKAFYNELHDWLLDREFVDMSFDFKDDVRLKRGEFPDSSNLTRDSDYYENQFTIIKKPGGVSELELKWEAKNNHVPFSGYGVVFFKLDLSVRNWKKKEFIDANNKKHVLDSGAWEFRNKLEYQNTVVKDYLDTIYFVKDSMWLKELYLKNVYMKKVKDDIELFVVPKFLAGIMRIIEKHFT
ncbi:MAG: hypothetical protein ACOC16_03935 [Nanoarchaeota archaeon]